VATSVGGGSLLGCVITEGYIKSEEFVSYWLIGTVVSGWIDRTLRVDVIVSHHPEGTGGISGTVTAEAEGVCCWSPSAG